MSHFSFLADLEAEVLSHPVWNHPLVERFETQQVDLKHARLFALAYYPHILRTRLYQAAALSICPEEQLQMAFALILQDEYAEGNERETHMSIYRRFMTGLGLTPREWGDAPFLPELELYIDRHYRLTQQDHFLAAAGAAGVAMEWPIPALYQKFVKGFSALPGIQPKNLEFFIGHAEVDIEHSSIIRHALLPHCTLEESRQHLRRGARLSLDARSVFFDGLERFVFQDEIPSRADEIEIGSLVGAESR